MATAPRTRDEARVPLTRERILLAASTWPMRMASRRSPCAGSPRSSGWRRCRSTTTSRNKQDLLGGICDLVVSEYELPAPGAPWKAAVRRTAISAYDALIRHPWAASLLLSGTPESRARIRYMDALLGAFRTGGFSAGMTDHAYHALDSHIMGFTLWVVGMNLGTQEELATMASDFLRELPRDDFPHLVEHIEQHLKPRDPEEEGRVRIRARSPARRARTPPRPAVAGLRATRRSTDAERPAFPRGDSLPMVTTAPTQRARMRQSIEPFLKFFAGPFSQLSEDPDVANFAVGNPQEIAMPSYVGALRDALEPRNKDWFGYKLSEVESQRTVAATLTAAHRHAVGP